MRLCPKCSNELESVQEQARAEIPDSKGWSVPERIGRRAHAPCGCVLDIQVVRPGGGHL